MSREGEAALYNSSVGQRVHEATEHPSSQILRLGSELQMPKALEALMIRYIPSSAHLAAAPIQQTGFAREHPNDRTIQVGLASPRSLGWIYSEIGRCRVRLRLVSLQSSWSANPSASLQHAGRLPRP